MSLHRFLNILCPVTCISCLVAGYALIGQWVALAPIVAAALIWLGIRRSPAAWLPSVALAINVCLAAVGLLVGASPFLMLVSAALALASWDLESLGRILAGDSSTRPAAILEKKHYQSLALAIGAGLLVALAGRMIHFQIPFGLMALLVILALFIQDRLWRLLAK